MVTPKLPWDLESEILSRVPPTSLKRLQLTCKRWNTLFKDQRFINNHMGKATTQMVLKKDESAYSFSLDFHGLHNRYDQFITITGKLQNKNLVVWNPCTGQTRWILSNDYAMNHMYYLGYGNKNKSCDSLKLLRLSYYYHQRQRVDTFEMYMSLTLIHGELFMTMLLMLKKKTIWLIVFSYLISLQRDLDVCLFLSIMMITMRV
ncbi:unnamed protein product [Brassica oleracea var. botrytis]|uniref:F-box domain-containing protein n=1 Tax=Brassica oleracea TaxID=3712 RepID=A0A3P6B7G2_BRAOL|nr:unnamed protein product [Brassica oleracea]